MSYIVLNKSIITKKKQLIFVREIVNYINTSCTTATLLRLDNSSQNLIFTNFQNVTTLCA